MGFEHIGAILDLKVHQSRMPKVKVLETNLNGVLEFRGWLLIDGGLPICDHCFPGLSLSVSVAGALVDPRWWYLFINI